MIVRLTEEAPSWQSDDAAIRLPVDLTRPEMLALTRQILAELGVVQPPESTMEARCFCGERIAIDELPCVNELVPVQRIYQLEVRRGA